MISRLALVTVTAVVVGCATPPKPQGEQTRWRTTLVTAMGTPTPGNIQAVSETFTFSGRIYAHATLVAETPVVPSTPTFTFKWFNSGKLVHERSGQQAISASPHFLVHAVPGSVVGAGVARVELHADGRLLVAREFVVSER